MSITANQPSRDDVEGTYERLRGPVLSVAGRRFPGFSPDDLSDLYQAAWEDLIAHPKTHVADLTAYLIGVVINKGLEELRRRRRRPALAVLGGPGHDGKAFGVDHFPDPDTPSPEEVVHTRAEADLARDLIATLGKRQRDVLKLKHEYGLTRTEIQAALKIDRRTYLRQLERASKALSSRLALVHSGQWCASLSQELESFAGGWADADQVRVAEQHLSHCAGCKRRVVELRRASARVAALLPAPHLAATGHADHLAAVFSSVKQHVVSLLGRTPAPAADATTQIAAGGGLRGSGAVASAVVACVLAGGGAATYCVQNGVPSALQDLVVALEPGKSEQGDGKPLTDTHPGTAEAPSGNQSPATLRDEHLPRGEENGGTESKAQRTQRVTEGELWFESGGGAQTSAGKASQGSQSGSSSDEFTGTAGAPSKAAAPKKPAPASGGSEFGPE